ncbi:MAG: hypothetical protein ACK5NF_02840 [Bacilli bacterium]
MCKVVKYILENYNVENVNDITDALKDMFKVTIQTMMNTEFDITMSYSKHDKKGYKYNYKNEIVRTILKSEFGFLLHQGIEIINLNSS